MITITRKTPGGEVSASWTPGLSGDQVDDIVRRAECFGVARMYTEAEMEQASQGTERVRRLAMIAGLSAKDTEYMAPELLESTVRDSLLTGLNAGRRVEQLEKHAKTARAEMREIADVIDRTVDFGDSDKPPVGRVAEVCELVEYQRDTGKRIQADNEKLTALIGSIDGLTRGHDAETAESLLVQIRDLIAKHNAPPLTLDTATGADLDVIAWRDFSVTREPGQSDADLRNNCIPF